MISVLSILLRTPQQSRPPHATPVLSWETHAKINHTKAETLLISKAAQQCSLGFLNLFPDVLCLNSARKWQLRKWSFSPSVLQTGFCWAAMHGPQHCTALHCTALHCTVCSTACRALSLQNKGEGTEERTPGACKQLFDHCKGDAWESCALIYAPSSDRSAREHIHQQIQSQKVAPTTMLLHVMEWVKSPKYMNISWARLLGTASVSNFHLHVIFIYN